MSKSSKVLIIVSSLIGLCLFIFCTRGIWSSAADRIKQERTVKEAYSTAVEYYTEKYGTSPVITETEPVRIGKTGVTFATVFSGYVVFHEESCKIVYYNGKCFDTKQYDEICAAAAEAYFKDDDIGQITDCDIKLSFMAHTGVTRSYSYEDEWNIDREKYISEYFDGDIERFFSEIPHTMKAYVTYSGYAEKYDSYRSLLENKLSVLKGICDEAYLYVKDSSAAFEENAHYGEISKVRYIPTAHNYMEHIAVGHLSEDITVYQTLWHDIDEYTAVSDITSDAELNGRDFIFEKTELYRNCKAVCRIKREQSNVFVIGKAYYAEINDNKDIFLRLDKKQYGINENTVPLIVYESGNALEYETAGWVNEEIHGVSDDSWHYLDDEYMYLMLDGIKMKNSVLAFVQAEDMITEK
ncbi:MAG: hypothetical protein IJZ72_06900 [Oscillospiraceae bacterium]|nr:hypothetical protein [Oscillospiraceae bacterium]